MIIVHHLNNSRSHRVLWLLEELGLPYEIKNYQRNPVTMLAPKELKEIHPLGKSPVLTDGGKVIAESGAILEYLVDTYGGGKFRPNGPDRIAYNYFMHYAEGSLMPILLLSLIFSRLSKPPVPIFARSFGKIFEVGMTKMITGPQIKTNYDFLERELGSRSWFGGEDFSAADIQMSFPVEAGESRVGFAERPHLRRFLERIRARPAYKRAIDRGGPVMLDGF